MARKAPRARFVKPGTSCKPGWTKKIIKVNGGTRELCLAPKKK